MASTDLTMPVAVPGSGVDPTTFYATFTGKLTATWSPGEPLLIAMDASDQIRGVYAPIKAAIQFASKGSVVDGSPLAADSLLLATWPLTYAQLASEIPSEPAKIRIENVDATTVRAAADSAYSALGRPADATDAFMSGNGVLLVTAGTQIGAAAPDPSSPPSTPNAIKIYMFDAAANEISPVEFLAAAADKASIDKTLHPLLAQLALDSWIEVFVLDDSGSPLTGEPYDLYLADGSKRSGTTDSRGRMYETGVAAGAWGLDLPNQPSFAAIPAGTS